MTTQATEQHDLDAVVVEAQHALRVIVPDLAPRVSVRVLAAPDGDRCVGVDTHRLDPQAAATVQRIVSYVKQCRRERASGISRGPAPEEPTGRA
ncbi:hypothetical protein [Georgenia thermotolerans]|uniref:Uncharacterized protein n=1 Tax=Georgenia thermotolerans TaxID=527326 RepID=A0A7J5URF5_9MICO|nr:hypothetical protein [Georgenia thermotolerans]KAE8765032.1 hypothetical protein GB883_05955 [Georgenia thermotolerans]